MQHRQPGCVTKRILSRARSRDDDVLKQSNSRNMNEFTLREVVSKFTHQLAKARRDITWHIHAAHTTGLSIC